MTISCFPDFSTPRELLDVAEEILMSAQIDTDHWTLGGGTALATRIQHRESRDIDIFFTDAQLITMVAPRLNQVAETCSTQYDESSNFVKIHKPNGIDGEIDFIVSPILTPCGFDSLELWDRVLNVESGPEIIAKKLFHRAANFTGRDIFDVAAFGSAVGDPQRTRLGALVAAASVFAAKIPVARSRIKKLRDSGKYAEEIGHIQTAADFAQLAPLAPQIALEILAEIEAMAGFTGRAGTPPPLYTARS